IAGVLADVKSPLILVGDINVALASIVSEVLIAKLGLVPARPDFGLDVALARPSDALKPEVVSSAHLFTDRVLFSTGQKRTLSDHPCLLVDYDLIPCRSCSG